MKYYHRYIFSLLKASLLLLVFLSVNSHAQSKKLWMMEGENAYTKKDYASAAYFYSKVLDDTTILETFVLPYEAQMVNLRIKNLIKVPELKLKNPFAKKDSASLANVDSTKKPKAEYKPMNSIDYVYYKLGHSYFKNSDYSHAAKIFKVCVERNSYPDARFYHALSLMSVKKHKEALDELGKVKKKYDETVKKITQFKGY